MSNKRKPQDSNGSGDSPAQSTSAPTLVWPSRPSSVPPPPLPAPARAVPAPAPAPPTPAPTPAPPVAARPAEPVAGQRPESQSASTWDKQPVIELVDVHKTFGSLKVLDGVTCRIPRGEITVLMGPSGTGKSVTLRHIVGLLPPDRGDV